MCIHKNTPIWTDNCVLWLLSEHMQICLVAIFLNLKQQHDIKAFSNISVGCIGGFTKKNLPHKLFHSHIVKLQADTISYTDCIESTVTLCKTKIAKTANLGVLCKCHKPCPALKIPLPIPDLSQNDL